MKKIILSVLCLIFAFSLTACSIGNSQMNDDKTLMDNQSTIPNMDNGTIVNGEDIGRDKAKEIALKHAGLEERNVTDLEIDLDTDAGKKVYEVTFDADGFEYDYDIDVKSGEIVFSERDPD